MVTQLYDIVLLGWHLDKPQVHELSDLRDIRPGFSSSIYSNNSYCLLNFIATNALVYARFVESDDGNIVHFRMKAFEQWNRKGLGDEDLFPENIPITRDVLLFPTHSAEMQSLT